MEAGAARGAGARIVTCPPGVAARERCVRRIAVDEGIEQISSFDDPRVILGQGTVGVEILAAAGPGALVAPVGGGGLLAGMAMAVDEVGHGHTRLIGVEPEQGDVFVRSLSIGRPVEIEPPLTVCDGARATSPGALAFPIVQRLVDDVVVASDDEVLAARDVLAASGIHAEPTGALALAGAIKLGLTEGTVVVSGGNAPA